jgi:hypothetical protein
MEKLKKGMMTVFAVAILIIPIVSIAGDLEPPAGPDDAGSAMYTLEDIYNYLDTGVAGSKRGEGFAGPSSPLGSTGHTLDDVHAKIGERCITCEGTLSSGGRWCDKGDGTVKDMTTGLVWLKDAGWGGRKPWSAYNSYDDAHTRAGILQAGLDGAGLSDGSVVGDWRLPTKSEFVGIIQGTENVRSSNMHFFTNVKSSVYWSSSTTHADDSVNAWFVSMYYGYVDYDVKGFDCYVWPVRPGNW